MWGGLEMYSIIVYNCEAEHKVFQTEWMNPKESCPMQETSYEWAMADIEKKFKAKKYEIRVRKRVHTHGTYKEGVYPPRD
tara:strand:- start:11524 stop:11763 length:240 start_codon:yes stop_codon:yes gene_type:complete